MYAEIEFARVRNHWPRDWKAVTRYRPLDPDFQKPWIQLWMCYEVNDIYQLPPEARQLWVCVSSRRPRAAGTITFRFGQDPKNRELMKVFDRRCLPLPALLEDWLRRQYQAGARWIWCEYA